MKKFLGWMTVGLIVFGSVYIIQHPNKNTDRLKADKIFGYDPAIIAMQMCYGHAENTTAAKKCYDELTGPQYRSHK